jgi:hypothetical protein
VQKLRSIFGGFSPIAVTALFSALILGSVIVAETVALLRPQATPVAADETPATSTPVVAADDLQQLLLLGLATSTDASATSTNDHLSIIGPMVSAEIIGSYEALVESGSYTKEDLRNAGAQIAANMKAAVTYEAFRNTDFKTDPDVSVERVRTYRDDLQRTLAPLSAIPGAEYEIYAQYVQTNDPKYLMELKDAANTYRTVANAAAALTIPRDSIDYHRDLLNSLRAFAPVLDGLVDYSTDQFASLALLRTYNEKEQGIYNAFNRMRSYYGKKGL